MKATSPTIFVAALLQSVCLNLLAQPVPHHFSSLTLLPDGSAALRLDGSVSGMFNLTGAISNQFLQAFDIYRVEASANLVSWTPLAFLQRANNDLQSLLISDTSVIGLDRRFYRMPTNHQITLFPPPSGTYTVGAFDRVMVDPARTNSYRYTPPTNAFMVSFWYPADPAPTGVSLDLWWDPKLAADPAWYEGLDARWAKINGTAAAHRFVGIPVAAGTNRCPVIIYSQGVGHARKGNSHKAEEIASHGYIVVVPDHIDCFATEFPDGRYLHGVVEGDQVQIPSRLKDIAFLVNELTKLDASDPILAGRLDLNRIALFGHSFGGEVVQISRSDSRVKCVAVYDGTYTEPSGPGLTLPSMTILGQMNEYFNEDLTLFNASKTNAIFLQVKGADHATVGDWAWWGEIPQGRSPALAIDACLVWFFDTFLKGEKPAFPTNPEIYNVKVK